MKKQSKLDSLLETLQATQQQVEEELEHRLAEKREQFKYSLRRGKVLFERNVRRLQQQQRLGSLRYIYNAPMRAILTAPVIYGMIVPLTFFDFSLSLYQHICFRVYGIPLVKRSEFIVIDRHRLPYLNAIQKMNCVYCGYGNGLLAYTREILARTEQFWCPIKHARRTKGLHNRTQKFMDYGDAQAWKEQLVVIRKDWNDADSK